MESFGCFATIAFVDSNSALESEQVSLLIGKKDDVCVLVSMLKYYVEVVDFLEKNGYVNGEDYWYINCLEATRRFFGDHVGIN